MIKYRPHRGGLKEAMAESMMFENIADMLKHIEKQHQGMVSTEDIVIGESIGADKRIGWNSTRNICAIRYGDEKYAIPQCIAWCDLGERDCRTRKVAY